MTQAVTVRETLRPGDIGNVIRLHGLIYGEEYDYRFGFEGYVAESMAEFVRQYDPALDRVWLCEDGDTLVGSLFLMHREQSAQLRYFLIASDYRGQRLGNTLMQRYMAALTELNYTHSFLWTAHELPAAAALYRQHGFELTQEQPSDRFGKTLTEQKYEWHKAE